MTIIEMSSREKGGPPPHLFLFGLRQAMFLSEYSLPNYVKTRCHTYVLKAAIGVEESIAST